MLKNWYGKKFPLTLVVTITYSTMETTEFKGFLKGIKNSLKGKTLQIISPTGARPYTSLKEFGNAILQEEQKGYSFCIAQVWTNNGTIGVKSISHFIQLLLSNVVTGIQFKCYQQQELKYDMGSLD